MTSRAALLPHAHVWYLIHVSQLHSNGHIDILSQWVAAAEITYDFKAPHAFTLGGTIAPSRHPIGLEPLPRPLHQVKLINNMINDILIYNL